MSNKPDEHPLVGVAREMVERSRARMRAAGDVVRKAYWDGLTKDLKRGNPNAWTDYAIRLATTPAIADDGEAAGCVLPHSGGEQAPRSDT